MSLVVIDSSVMAQAIKLAGSVHWCKQRCPASVSSISGPSVAIQHYLSVIWNCCSFVLVSRCNVQRDFGIDAFCREVLYRHCTTVEIYEHFVPVWPWTSIEKVQWWFPRHLGKDSVHDTALQRFGGRSIFFSDALFLILGVDQDMIAPQSLFSTIWWRSGHCSLEV